MYLTCFSHIQLFLFLEFFIMVIKQFALISVLITSIICYKVREDKTKCPTVKSLRNFDINGLLGSWYVVQYYATSEEEVIYRCMRAVFSMPNDGMEIEMNITYSFIDDPNNEMLVGNITWSIPEPSQPAHWVHAEDPYEGIYNTYILDFNNNDWSLLLHCAEKPKSPRYLTSLIMSKQPRLADNVINFLRDKLPKYDITLDYMFPMYQNKCEEVKLPNYGDSDYTVKYLSSSSSSSSLLPKVSKHKRHKRPLKRRNRGSRSKNDSNMSL
ncbi:hypothetical protein O3M35_009522 [Rhynocoris fuscipes]|uniref:VDE lipocalin domain-containing protein n=1 Tax=Rhynocoris fuscipes TaxID=488301 RepID=A0AAW1D8K7_9HEMI